MSNTVYAVRKVLILGLPNSGKSLLFTILTGRYVEVANAPLTTIDLNQAPLAQKWHIPGHNSYEIIDAPGMQSLFIGLEQNLLIREALFDRRPDVLLLCVDATRLKQSLSLVLEVQTLDLPMILVLTLTEEAEDRNIFVQADYLSRVFDVPVVIQRNQPANARQLVGELRRTRAARILNLVYPEAVDKALASLIARFPPNFSYPRSSAMCLLLGSTTTGLNPGLEEGARKQLIDLAATIIGQLNGDAQSIISNTWNRWIDATYIDIVRELRRPAQQIKRSQDTKQKIVLLDAIARLTRSTIFGPPILLVVLYLTFILVVDVANGISEWLGLTFWQPVHDILTRILPDGFWSELLIGDYGLISMGLANALLTVLPILSIFYLVFNTLEDIGYLPNLSVLTRRLLGHLGLGGSAIMPLILGFGCKTMATLTAKTMTSRREKYITIFLIAFAIPCAGQMGLNMSIIGRMGLLAFAISSLALLVVELAAGLILHRFLRQSEERDLFILQLPPIRIPNLKAIVTKTWYKLLSFLKESLAVFIYAAAFLFVLDRIGLLERLKTVLGPIVQGLLGLPASMIDALILLAARHEAAAAVIIDLIRKGELDFKQTIIAVTLTTMFLPCFANVMAMIRVLGGRDATVILVSVNIAALAATSLLNWLLTAIML
ncbi:ferrous iron transport protein B [Desulfovibrionales bacterium]